jgi:hypothetical protein
VVVLGNGSVCNDGKKWPNRRREAALIESDHCRLFLQSTPPEITLLKDIESERNSGMVLAANTGTLRSIA